MIISPSMISQDQRKCNVSSDRMESVLVLVGYAVLCRHCCSLILLLTILVYLWQKNH